MKLGTYLLLIPLAALFLILGLLFLFNKLDFKVYGLNFQQNTFKSKQEKKNQVELNRVGGILFVLLSVAILIIPYFSN